MIFLVICWKFIQEYSRNGPKSVGGNKFEKEGRIACGEGRRGLSNMMSSKSKSTLIQNFPLIMPLLGSIVSFFLKFWQKVGMNNNSLDPGSFSLLNRQIFDIFVSWYRTNKVTMYTVHSMYFTSYELCECLCVIKCCKFPLLNYPSFSYIL